MNRSCRVGKQHERPASPPRGQGQRGPLPHIMCSRWPTASTRGPLTVRGEQLQLAPITVKAALAWVRQTHRHLPNLQGGMFAVAIRADGELRGVAIAGNPPRVWQGTGRIVISRVSTDGAENGCSMLYGAICRAAKALGYRQAWTYTLPGELGTSLRAAGFIDMGLTKDEGWNRPSRSRATAIPGRKRRWLRILSAPASAQLAKAA